MSQDDVPNVCVSVLNVLEEAPAPFRYRKRLREKSFSLSQNEWTEWTYNNDQ